MNEAIEKLRKLEQFAKQRKSDQIKPPRQWAKEICELKTIEERRDLLAKVPKEFQHWVKFYVTQHFMRKPRKVNET